MNVNIAKQQAVIEATRGIELLAGFVVWVEQDGIQTVVALTGKHASEIKKFHRVFKILAHPSVQHAARQAQLSFSTVIDLGTAAYPLRKRKDRNKLLVELCHSLKGMTADLGLGLIREFIASWIGDSTKRPDVACMHKQVGKDGKRRLTAAFGAVIAARVDVVLHGLAEQIRQKEPELQYDEAYAKALVQKLLGSSEVAPALFGPMFMIATDYRFHSDGKITTTDGALINIQDVVDQELAPTGWAAVTGPGENEIPLVRAFVKVHNRFASQPQRLAAVIESLVCAWPGCEVSASKCQIHHMQANKHGGLTIGENLVPLCKQHNGENDDNPGQTVNGRIKRDPITGRPGLLRGQGDVLEYNCHPLVGKTITAYAQY